MRGLASRQLPVVLLLLWVLAGAAVLVQAWPAAASGPGDGRGERRRVILVAGICSTDPAITFAEIYQWLQTDLDYRVVPHPVEKNDILLSEILLFSYRSDRRVAYEKSDTTAPIAESASRLRTLIDDARVTEDETFDIIAHSQGGVVALYAAASDPFVRQHVHSIVTIESPLQGVDWGRSAVGAVNDIFNCGGAFDLEFPPSIQDMQIGSPVVTAVTTRDWNGEDNPYVTNVVNIKDQVISDWVCGGGNGSVPEAHIVVQGDFGGACPDIDPLVGGEIEAHRLPLDILTNPLAPAVRGALMHALIEYQLREVFLAAGSYLRSPLLYPAPAPEPQPLTLAFVGNESSGLATSLSSPPVAPQTLTSAFVGNDSASLSTGLTAPAPAPRALAAAFIGNDSSSLAAGLGSPPVSPQPLTLAFVGNESSGLAAGLGSPPVSPQPLTSAFLGNASSALAAGLWDPFAPPPPPVPTPTPVPPLEPAPIPSMGWAAAALLAALFAALLLWRVPRRSKHYL
ncbi:MAG: hypothetical protein HY683_09545 [Chloroflexi bacterium]|nr:hypothetical protein [Chloroflexota bacterium]